MRRVVLALCLLLVLAGPAAAQQRQWGVKVGPVFTAIEVEPEDADYGMRVAATLGGFLVLPRTDRFALQLEALYTGRGGKASSPLVIETLTVKLDYIEFPVLARFTATRSASRSFFLFGGVAPALKLNAKVESGTTVTGQTYGASIDADEDYEMFDVAAIAGAGLDIGEYVVIDGRYSWGLMNVYKNPEVDATVKNRAFAFTVGFRF